MRKWLVMVLILTSLGTRLITNYHAIEAECDSTPDIGANGVVAINGLPTGFWFACNNLPFGTKIVIPELTGKIVWTCKDRMNRRYKSNMDLLVPKGYTLLDGAKRYEVFIKEVEENDR